MFGKSAAQAERDVIDGLARAFHAGEYRLYVVPPYPRGYVQVADHLPWDLSALKMVAGALCVFALVRATSRLVAPRVGRAVGRRLHGDAWLVSGHGHTLDWRRFGDVCHSTLSHVALTGFVLYALLPEVMDWMREPQQWWAFSQPPLSHALSAYYSVQIAANLEASLTMLQGVLSGRAKDLPMMVHHATTLFVITLAQRVGFIRVGAAVAILHDATDIPIDSLRIAQALESFPAVAASAISAIVSWGVLRGYAFPRLIIWSALTHTGHLWTSHTYAPSNLITIGYVLLVAPLVVLFLLSMHWLRLLTTKARATLASQLPRTQLDAGTAVIVGLIALAAAALERLVSLSPPALSPAPPPPLTSRLAALFSWLSRSPDTFFAVDGIAMLRTPRCGYYNMSEVLAAPAWEHLHPQYPAECDRYDLMSCDADVFDGAVWTRWSSQNWQLPLLAVAAYLLAIPLLTHLMKDRPPIRMPAVTAAWNFGLSAFSIAGAFYTVPHLLLNAEGGLLTRGFYASVCVHACSYGCGELGIFVALFIYSKFAELVDTLLLILRKAPVIPLHWYHHATVLLYCWHSYAARIGTGLWYAAMNYTVHSVMYFYFGLTQCGPKAKKLAKRFSMLITLMQLSQMVVGIVVTVSSIVYHAHGATCYVPLANSALGLGMYASYFALFFALFQSLYLTKRRKSRELEVEKLQRSSRAAGSSKATATHGATKFEGWAGKNREIEMMVSSGNEAIGFCAAGEAPAASRP